MRAIAEGKVEGFPSADVLKTVFVEHSLQGEEADLPVIEFVAKGGLFCVFSFSRSQTFTCIP